VSVIGYPVPRKAKAKMLCEAFCAGAGGTVSHDVSQLLPGPAAFYGLAPSTAHLWKQANADAARVWYYIDNAYTDPQREVYFRVTRNRLQHPGVGASDGKRFAALNIPIKPWRSSGSHVLLCPQSDLFMSDCVGYSGSWTQNALAALRQYTDRELRVRPWNGNKAEWFRTLPDDLRDCWALVTYSSSSAISAILAGIPAICTAEDCIAAPMSDRLGRIEAPKIPDNRREWASVVADHQWTVAELRDGTAWRALNA